MNLTEEFSQIQYECTRFYADANFFVKLWWYIVYVCRVMKLVITKATWKQKIFVFSRILAGLVDHVLPWAMYIGTFLLVAYIFTTVYLWAIPIMKLLHLPFSGFNDWLINTVPIGMQPSGKFSVGVVRFIAFLSIGLYAHLSILFVEGIQFCSVGNYEQEITMKGRMIYYTLRNIIALIGNGLLWGMLYFFCYYMTPDTWIKYTPHVLITFVVIVILICLVASEDGICSSLREDIHNMVDEYCDLKGIE